MEASLTTVFATFFNVAESQISLSFVAGSRRHLQEGEILVQITATDATEMNTAIEAIREPTFVSAVQTDITTAAATDSTLSVITITAASAPVVATTTTTTTSVMPSESVALMSMVALIFSALMF